MYICFIKVVVVNLTYTNLTYTILYYTILTYTILCVQNVGKRADSMATKAVLFQALFSKKANTV